MASAKETITKRAIGSSAAGLPPALAQWVAVRDVWLRRHAAVREVGRDDTPALTRDRPALNGAARFLRSGEPVANMEVRDRPPLLTLLAMRVIRPEPPSLAFVAPASRATRRAVLLGSALGLQRTPLLLPTQEESHAVYVLLAVLAALVVAWVAVT